MVQDKKITLKNWSICRRNDIDERLCLVGEVYGHEKFVDGTIVVTSNIVKEDMYTDHMTIETRNTLYTLYYSEQNEKFAEHSHTSYEVINYMYMIKQKERLVTK